MAEPSALVAATASQQTRSRVALVGGGRLFDAAAAALGALATPTSLDPVPRLDGSWLAVAVHDGWETRDHGRLREACSGAGIPWLPVRTELGHAVVGPVELPATAGCVTCAELRRSRLRRHQSGFEAVWRRHGTTLARRPSSWLTRLGCETVAALVADEAHRLAAGVPQPRTRAALLYVDLRTLAVARHGFLPEPACPHCGGLPDDDEATAAVVLASRPKPDPGTYRRRSPVQVRERLLATYVDAESGMIPALETGHDAGLATVRAPLGLRSGRTGVAGYGRTRSYPASEVVAVLEALERYGGLFAGGKRTVVRGSFADLSDRALDPRTLGLYPPERYQLPGFPFQPFHPELACAWVWGHSFARQAPVLVPATTAYYGTGGTSADRPFAYECSNGCALGGSLEEAILYAALEVAERDAFLLSWHARLPAARIDLGSAPDRRVSLLATTIEQETGCSVDAYDITVDHGVPCLWVMAVNQAGDPDAARAACAAAAHLDPVRAALTALSELGPMVTNLIRRYPEQAERTRLMASQPSEVQEMADHSLLYANPEVFDRFQFLVASTATRTFADAFAPGRPRIRNQDLRDDVDQLVGRFLDAGLDLIVVDQTTPEHRAADLWCVKAIVPGALPMTFGHDFRRLDGLPRLHQMPRLLGHRDRPLLDSEVNHDPHPFP